MTDMSRRQFITTAAAMGAVMSIAGRGSGAAESEVRFDFARPLEGWETGTGSWAIE